MGVVAAAEGYPGAYRRGDPIRGLDEAGREAEVVVFHGGTRLERDTVVTDGGRVLCVTALGADVTSARGAAYAAYEHISWSGKFCRRDIGLPRRQGAPGLESDGAPLGAAEGSGGGRILG